MGHGMVWAGIIAVWYNIIGDVVANWDSIVKHAGMATEFVLDALVPPPLTLIGFVLIVVGWIILGVNFGENAGNSDST